MELADLENTIGYKFQDRSLLELAVTHPSVRYEQHLPGDNQRMEYLGDAVLGLVTAEYLYLRNPSFTEGKLTMMRSAITSASALASIARTISLGPKLRLGKGEETSGGHHKENNLADALEAIFGAIYLDGGYQAVHSVFQNLFITMVESLEIQEGSDNPKGQLQEWAQKNGKKCPEYAVIKEEGPPHRRWFTVTAGINEQTSAEGQGPTKKSAEADAARNLLQQVRSS
ncbi:MAG TPA: ribonuclease III [Kiritimatiellia bacterium]|nr:ribonuclease III [Kiritimatiellia bacterium]